MYDMMAVTQMRQKDLHQEAEARRLAKLAQQSRRTISIVHIIQTLLLALR
jgi:hypothetical protein